MRTEHYERDERAMSQMLSSRLPDPNSQTVSCRLARMNYFTCGFAQT